MNNQLEINSFITSGRFRNIAINVFSENIDQSDFGNLDSEDCDIVYKSINKEHFSLIYKKNKLKIKSNSIVFVIQIMLRSFWLDKEKWFYK